MPGVILCTAGYDHSIRFWEATTGLCCHNIQFQESHVNKLAISHNKEFLAAAGHHHIRLYHISSSNNQTAHVGMLEGHTSNILSIGFQQEERFLYSGSEDQTIKIWDLRATVPKKRDYKVGAPVNCLALHPNQGELISADEQGNLILWDLTSDRPSCKVSPTGKVGLRSVSISADGKRCVCASNHGDVFVYELKRSESLQFNLIKSFKAHNTYICKCLISPNSRQLATASADHTVKLWDMNGDKLQHQQTLRGHKRWVWDCAYSSDSAYLVTASSDATAKLWDIGRGEPIKEYKGHQKAVVCVALNDSPTRKKHPKK